MPVAARAVLPERRYTYNGPDKHTGKVTYGGYSDSIVVDKRFVLRVPANLSLAGAAPLHLRVTRLDRRAITVRSPCGLATG